MRIPLINARVEHQSGCLCNVHLYRKLAVAAWRPCRLR